MLPASTDLNADERALLVDGLDAVCSERAVDDLAQTLVREWDRLTVDERVASLTLIGVLLATTVQQPEV